MSLVDDLRRIAVFRLANPDLAIEWKAADALEAKDRKIERLREALQMIVQSERARFCDVIDAASLIRAVEIANAALHPIQGAGE